MSKLDFAAEFKRLTDHPPFPWQTKWYEHLVEGEFDKIQTCNLPTGLGKTSVLAAWLIAQQNNPQVVPRRLVYVVNRRTVVDQTTTEAEKLQKIMGADKLAISTLRGQFADNRAWSADPSLPAIICGTVDMIGSRLLFSGYGCGFKTRPLHAGFLGQDVLLIHDEAHLEPAFQKLLEAIRDEQKRCKEFQKFHIVELSATARSEGESFGLSKLDRNNVVVKKRLKATKELHLRKLEDEKKLSEEVCKWALKHRDSGEAIIIFVRSVEDVNKIAEKLGKEDLEVQTLTGTMRGLERDRMADPRKKDACPIFARYLQRPKPDCEEHERWQIEPQDGTVYLICTSAGEVGVNISADHLVCDLSTFESMAQRFGRVNRFGLHKSTQIDALCPSDFDEADPYQLARQRTLSLLRKLCGDASPLALDELDRQEKLDAFTPDPRMLKTSDILFDAWSLTTINKPIPARPPIDAYLHGIEDDEKAVTSIAWREEVGKLQRGFENNSERKEFELYAKELLDSYSLEPHELLRDSTFRKNSGIKAKLAKLAEWHGDVQVWMQSPTGEITVDSLLKIASNAPLAGRTVILPPEVGGLLIDKGKSKGLFNPNAKYQPEFHHLYDIADEWKDKEGPLRKRVW